MRSLRFWRFDCARQQLCQIIPNRYRHHPDFRRTMVSTLLVPASRSRPNAVSRSAASLREQSINRTKRNNIDIESTRRTRRWSMRSERCAPRDRCRPRRPCRACKQQREREREIENDYLVAGKRIVIGRQHLEYEHIMLVCEKKRKTTRSANLDLSLERFLTHAHTNKNNKTQRQLNEKRYSRNKTQHPIT
jgi:hypothetical protein